MIKNLPANAGDFTDVGLTPGSGRSPGGGHGTPLQHSCLGNPTERGARQATVHSVKQGWTRLKRPNTHKREATLSLPVSGLGQRSSPALDLDSHQNLLEPWFSWFSGLQTQAGLDTINSVFQAFGLRLELHKPSGSLVHQLQTRDLAS